MLPFFHESTRRWFLDRFTTPTEPQAQAWPSIKSHRDTLIAAPTGSGKTLAAFLSAIDDLVRLGVEGQLDDTTHVVYVSPLKALSNDIQRNLQEPLAGIQEELRRLGQPEFDMRVLVRTGDTPAAERARMTKRPPHIVVTTPESLYIMLTSEGGRRMLSTARTLILDEIHAMVGDRRGAHLALSVERLEALVRRRLVRIGLSATQKPIEEVARYLVGSDRLDQQGNPSCAIVDTGHRRRLDVAVEVPGTPLGAVMSNECWEETYERLCQLIQEHRTTLLFVNTRRMAERISRHLGERLGDELVAAHHGSLSRDRRLQAEQRLKSGELRVIVATASLELGIDIGSVELVCQIGSTRSIAALLQRVGRSGHQVGGLPKGRLFPTTRDELIECVALLDSVRRGELDQLCIPRNPLDVLAQQIVAAAACDDWSEDEMFALIRRAYPFRNLSRESFDSVVRMLAEGFTTRRGRRGALIHQDGINHRIRGRRAARLTAITNGGAIPDTADYDVILEPEATFIGSVNEDFAIESMQGDIFQLGNASWRILRVEQGRMRVEDAHGLPPTIPFWLGEANSRTTELSISVSRLRDEIDSRLVGDGGPPVSGRALAWLVDEVGVAQAAAEQIVEYLAAAKVMLGVIPTQRKIVFERFFDESGGTQLVIHSPFGSRINRAWGLALRKRFCRKFNFELQAAATEDSIVLSLGATHSFPLEDVFQYLRSASVRELLRQALLAAPMFTVRWRWVTSRALAVLRRRGGKKIPANLQRMNAEDLLSVVFPDQLACQENMTGDREIPDHPLVNQTISDCLEEAMDVEGLERLLTSIERNERELIARDLTEPSPLAQEILNARPYAFLDDAPLEERRTNAVMNRRWADPESASDLGALDQAAIDRVREEAWPLVRSADELHDALMQLGFITEAEGSRSESTEGEGKDWIEYLGDLIRDGRVGVMTVGDARLWVAAERLNELKQLHPDASIEPELPLASIKTAVDDALVEVLRGRLEGLGPATADQLARSGGFNRAEVEGSLMKLEAEGFIMRGKFSPGAQTTEWCVRHLLARIHRYTLNRLRKEIEPVSSADFMRFLFEWQRVSHDHQAEGPEGLAAVLEQLEGFEAPAAAWEGDILPSRVADYDPAWLDGLCLSGRVVWSRLTPPQPNGERGRRGPVRATPLAFLGRRELATWRRLAAAPGPEEMKLSPSAESVLEHLSLGGASFFADILEGTNLLGAQVEEGLAELVAWGLVTADSFTGLRALLVPSSKRTKLSRRRALSFAMEHAGRWSKLARPNGNGGSAMRNGSGQDGYDQVSLDRLARALLRRYGVVFRRLLERESLALPWRELVRFYRRAEARGELRGGRFVAGHSGEQYALPEAVGLLRSVRRSEAGGELISVSAADPLNLAGIITPGPRVPTLVSNRVLYRDGVPIATLEAGKAFFLADDLPESWEAKKALVQRKMPPELRVYLGSGRAGG